MDYGGLGNGIFRGKWVSCTWILEVIIELISSLLFAMSEGGEARELNNISGVALFLNLLFLCVWEIWITKCLVNSLCSYEIELS